nr:allantoinase AllB [Chloroflexia bacterium]
MARADVVIENGTIVNEGGSFTADLVIGAGRIAAVAVDAAGWTADERIDASGLWIIPGGIDVHTHFEEPDP